MRRPHRSIETFDISLMAVVTKAMGAFLVLMLLLMPYYSSSPLGKDEAQELARKVQDADAKIKGVLDRLGDQPASKDLETARESLGSGQHLIDQLKRAIDQLSAQVTRLEDEVKAKANELDEAKSELAALKTQVTQLTKERDDAKAALDPLKAQVAQLQKDLDDAKKQLDPLKAQVAQLQKDLDDAKKQLDPLKAQVSQLQAENDDLKKKLAELGDTSALKAQIDQLQKQMDQLKEDNEQLKKDKDKLVSQLNDITAERDKLKQELDKAKAAAKNRGSSAEISKLRNENEDLKRQLANITGSLIAAQFHSINCPSVDQLNLVIVSTDMNRTYKDDHTTVQTAGLDEASPGFGDTAASLGSAFRGATPDTYAIVAIGKTATPDKTLIRHGQQLTPLQAPSASCTATVSALADTAEYLTTKPVKQITLTDYAQPIWDVVIDQDGKISWNEPSPESVAYVKDQVEQAHKLPRSAPPPAPAAAVPAAPTNQAANPGMRPGQRPGARPIIPGLPQGFQFPRRP
jgi:uncharacterized coiled-coil DUF342 family protein